MDMKQQTANDSSGDNDRSRRRVMFAGFAGSLAILLTTIILCIGFAYWVASHLSGFW